MLGVSLFVSCKNKIQCVCVEKKTRGALKNCVNILSFTDPLGMSKRLLEANLRYYPQQNFF